MPTLTDLLDRIHDLHSQMPNNYRCTRCGNHRFIPDKSNTVNNTGTMRVCTECEAGTLHKELDRELIADGGDRGYGNDFTDDELLDAARDAAAEVDSPAIVTADITERTHASHSTINNRFKAFADDPDIPIAERTDTNPKLWWFTDE